MSDLIRRILEEAEKEGRVHVVKLGPGESETVIPDKEAEAKEEAAHIAEMNRILYEAHICAGFTGSEALALTVAVIKSMEF